VQTAGADALENYPLLTPATTGNARVEEFTGARSRIQLIRKRVASFGAIICKLSGPNWQSDVAFYITGDGEGNRDLEMLKTSPSAPSTAAVITKIPNQPLKRAKRGG
jgi:hypothetical protein